MNHYYIYVLLYVPLKEIWLRSLDQKNQSSESSPEIKPPFVYPEVGPPFVYNWCGVCINGDPNRSRLDSIKEAGQWIGDVANKAWEKWCKLAVFLGF